MANDKKQEEQEKGFVIKDKRFSAPKEDSQVKEEYKRDEAPPQESVHQEDSLPEVNFVGFLLSLSTSVLIQLGVIEDPISKKANKNLPLAKQTIDLIGLLKDKTKGNLTPEEEKMTEQILYDLRMWYVKASE